MLDAQGHITLTDFGLSKQFEEDVKVERFVH